MAARPCGARVGPDQKAAGNRFASSAVSRVALDSRPVVTGRNHGLTTRRSGVAGTARRGGDRARQALRVRPADAQDPRRSSRRRQRHRPRRLVRAPGRGGRRLFTPARRGSTGSSLGAISSSTRPADHRRRRRPQSGRRRPQAQPPHVVLLRRDRSMLQTGQPKPDAGSQSGTVQANADGSTDVYFGPAPPDERENYWIRPSRAKGSSRSCGSTARRSRSSTRAGGPAKSNRSDHQPQHDETTAGSWPRMTTTISGQQERLALSLAAAAVLAGCQDRRSLAARAGGRAGRLR
jgi:hypothetical protein